MWNKVYYYLTRTSTDNNNHSGRRRPKTKVALESRRKPLLGSHEPGLSEESLENEEVLDGHAQNLRDSP